MEDVNEMSHGSFWMVMKEGEQQFEGLYEVLVYKEKQSQQKGDFYDPKIVDNVQLFCQSFAEQSDMFEVWLHRLCACIQHCADDELAHQRLIEIWRLCNDLQGVIQKKLWMPYDMPSANNQHFGY